MDIVRIVHDGKDRAWQRPRFSWAHSSGNAPCDRDTENEHRRSIGGLPEITRNE